MTFSPFVSLILPVYNGDPYLAEAIDSILNQTWKDFELIIINDGSLDGSAEIIRGYDDPRIRYYEHKNIGLAATLNRGIELAKGTYIARQDQDDISMPERLAKQLEFLEAKPDYGMVGTWALIREGYVDSARVHSHPIDNAILKFDLNFNNPFVHSSMMIRKSVFRLVGGYTTDISRQPPEDYELWSRIAMYCKVANIPEILVIYREVQSSMSRSGTNPFLDNLVTISAENISRFLSNDLDKNPAHNLACLVHGAYDRMSNAAKPEKLAQLLLEATEHYCIVHGISRDQLMERACVICHSFLSNYRHHKYGKMYFVLERIWQKIKGVIS